MELKAWMIDTLTRYTTKLKAVFVNKTGDTMTGLLKIDNCGLTSNADSLNTLGNIVAGSKTKTAYTMIANIRRCASDGNRSNTAAFFVNSDGTAKFCHKTGDLTGNDDAYMTYGPNGFKVAYSGKSGTKPTIEYNLLDSNTAYDKSEIDALIASLQAQIDSLKS